eukprot:jgi/Undpi1/1574/HiC_scaffold_11.g04964.m1
MVNLDRKRCVREDCLASPSHGFPGDERQSLCAEHAKAGMVKLSRQRAICPYPGCLVSASYGERGGRAVRFCATHATEGMVSLGGKRCGREGCQKRATYGAIGTRKREFCARHSREGMVNVNSKRSTYPQHAPRNVGRSRALLSGMEGGRVCDSSYSSFRRECGNQRVRFGVERSYHRGAYHTYVGEGVGTADCVRCPCINCSENNSAHCLTSPKDKKLPTYPMDGGGGTVSLGNDMLDDNVLAESRATHAITDNMTTVRDTFTEKVKTGTCRDRAILGSENDNIMIESRATGFKTTQEHKANTARAVTTTATPYVPDAAIEYGVPWGMQRTPLASTQIGDKDHHVGGSEAPAGDSRGDPWGMQRTPLASTQIGDKDHHVGGSEAPAGDSLGGSAPIDIHGHDINASGRDTDINDHGIGNTGHDTPDSQPEPSTAALPRPSQVSSLIKTEMGWLTWTWGAVGDCR